MLAIIMPFRDDRNLVLGEALSADDIDQADEEFKPKALDVPAAAAAAKKGKAEGKSSAASAASADKAAFDLQKLKAFLARVLSFTKTVGEVAINVNGQCVFRVRKQRSPAVPRRLAAPLVSPSGFFRVAAIAEAELTFTAEEPVAAASLLCSAQPAAKRGAASKPPSSSSASSAAAVESLSLRHVQAEAEVKLDEQFAAKCHRIMKKNLPKLSTVQMLYPSAALTDSGSVSSPAAGSSSAASPSPLRQLLLGLSPVRGDKVCG
jgi:hypothetical protein